jgi:uncharacterized protein (DUF305 family)
LSSGTRLASLVAAVAAVVAVASMILLYTSRPPATDSPEAGFARDMMVHHDQAVEMAGIIRDRTSDEHIRALATDILLTQQGQIGQMQGWLDAWGLPATGPEPPMAWMGHPLEEGRMPGMAAQQEINRLRTLPPEEADVLFLRLMIPHHQAALPMSEAIIERTGRPEVIRLAESIAASQAAEIEVMQQMLEERGEDRLEDEPAPHEHHPGRSDHGH